MTQDFFLKHKDAINAAIAKSNVQYAASSGAGTNTVVHCYYVTTKNVRVSAYVIKHKKTDVVYKHILKVMVTHGSKNQPMVSSAQDTGKYAKKIFNTLSAKYDEQISRTQLKHNWRNQAFVNKR